jgi:dynein heavy chain
LKNYDTSKYPEAVFVKLRNTYLNRPEYEIKDIFKRSQAASFMATWVIAVNKYQKVLKVVEPKEKKYNEVKVILEKAESELA